MRECNGIGDFRYEYVEAGQAARGRHLSGMPRIAVDARTLSTFSPESAPDHGFDREGNYLRSFRTGDTLATVPMAVYRP